MTAKHHETEQDQSERQQRRESSKQAHERGDKNNQPSDLVNRTVMKRQGKNMHQQDGKK